MLVIDNFPVKLLRLLELISLVHHGIELVDLILVCEYLSLGEHRTV